ncbi:hypothetical protein [Simkania sp.]|uniref:hypothetical protein n=1 Tax=Simkania sp. TaxID=34094 RepID=UPI003B522E8D
MDNKDAFKQIYNQRFDPQLGGCAACHMISLNTANQLKTKPKLSGENIDFRLSSDMLREVAREDAATTLTEQQEILEGFDQFFSIDMRAQFPIISKSQLKTEVPSKAEVTENLRRRGASQGLIKLTNLGYLAENRQDISYRFLTNSIAQAKPDEVLIITMTHDGSGESSESHDIVAQVDKQSKVFRLVDPNIGVLEYSSPKAFDMQAGSLLQQFYGDRFNTYIVSAY